MKLRLNHLVREFGEPYSEMLGIDLRSGRSSEVAKWFLAALLPLCQAHQGILSYNDIQGIRKRRGSLTFENSGNWLGRPSWHP